MYQIFKIWYIAYTYSTSYSTLAKFQMLSSYTWLLATILDKQI